MRLLPLFIKRPCFFFLFFSQASRTSWLLQEATPDVFSLNYCFQFDIRLLEVIEFWVWVNDYMLGCGMLNVEVDLTITLCVTVVSFLLCSSFTGSISLSVMVLFNS
jgi:hypothetical protein